MSLAASRSSESTLTDRYQTTIPASVRQVLGLNKGDRICYDITPEGQVVLSRATQTHDDPVLAQFLNFLERDLENHPQHLQSVPANYLLRIQSLVSEVNVDLDAPLSDEDE